MCTTSRLVASGHEHLNILNGFTFVSFLLEQEVICAKSDCTNSRTSATRVPGKQFCAGCCAITCTFSQRNESKFDLCYLQSGARQVATLTAGVSSRLRVSACRRWVWEGKRQNQLAPACQLGQLCQCSEGLTLQPRQPSETVFDVSK